jgi:hypothetical protein
MSAVGGLPVVPASDPYHDGAFGLVACLPAGVIHEFGLETGKPRHRRGATAILDRILHRAEIIQITGKSYRLKDHACQKRKKTS